MAAKQVMKESIAGHVPTAMAERLESLRRLFPDAFTEGKLDLAKLRDAVGDVVDDRAERYSFSWAGKRDAIRLLQMPSRATLVPCPDESVNWEGTKNLFIEGDNLEVLKLLYKSYAGRVKLTYIDPPYNTGQDFIYPDNFADPLDAYLRLTGQKDANGNLLTSNPETNGRYHSAWLSMMYPRLFVARQLMAQDGLIFLSVDDHEIHNARLVMNELFGEETFIAQLIWKGRQFTDSRALSGVSTDHEYVLVYSRSPDAALLGVPRDESKFSNPDNDPRGDWMSRSILGLATKEQRPNLHFTITDPATGNKFDPPDSTGWRYSRERMQQLIDTGCILFPKNPDGRPREKKFRADLEKENSSFPSITSDVYTSHGTAEIRELFGFQAFSFPKPSELIRRFVEQATGPDDIVLDFFAGSATTGHAVYAQNQKDGGHRAFICVQLPEPLDPEGESAKRGFSTIAQVAKERLRLVIAQMQAQDRSSLPLASDEEPADLGFRVFKLRESHNRQWSGLPERDAEALGRQMALFVDPLLPGWKPLPVVYDVAMREGFSLSCRVEELPPQNTKPNTVYRVTDAEKEQVFLICLDDKVDQQISRSLSLTNDDMFVCRDVALTDEIAANLALQCRLRTI
jgi:adenine-specific DNA-methyltransferase